MNKISRKLLLCCIKEGRPFSSLTRYNYTYGQIADFIIDAEINKLIKHDGERYSLTEQGKIILSLPEDLREENRCKNKYLRSDILSVDDLYVPKIKSKK